MKRTRSRATTWRGRTPAGERPPGNATRHSLNPAASGPADAAHAGRVLLLVRHAANRAHVAKALADQVEILSPAHDGVAPERFDLAIVDAAGLQAWWDLLLDAKFRAEPTFLPVVLLLSKTDVRDRVRTYWDVIDEFVTTPTDPDEFVERIQLLLRARRLALEQRDHLAYVVNHDRVTGLPNQHLFMTRLEGLVRDASVLGGRAHVAVLHVPLARVLKSLGHRGMDTVATRVTARLTALAGNDATLARLTTEAWGLALRPGATLPDVTRVLARVRTVCDDPFDAAGETVRLAPRIGVGVYPVDGGDAATVLDRAMAALSTADGPDPVFYAHEVQHAALRAIRTESSLHRALERGEFEAWLQPQIDLRTGAWVGTETLVRWRLASGELVPPDRFLPVAEETGLIRRIDGWMLRRALALHTDLRRAGQAPPRICVNVCVQDVTAPGFDEAVLDAIASAGAAPADLELELTETDLIEAGSDGVHKLEILRDAGVHVAVDDFGTGYSSLAYLRSLPITKLKIDRRFVRDLPHADKDVTLVEALVWLAKRFDLETVAEGIETDTQAACLRRLGVDVGQGFLYAKPMPPDAFRDWIRSRPTSD